MVRLGLIGGSGLHNLSSLQNCRTALPETPWGYPSADIEIGTLEGVEICFLSRHGTMVRKPPHMINYRANIWALADLKPDFVVAFCTVGSILPEDVPGTLTVPDQIIDYSWGRQTSYNKGDSMEILHIDFTDPFDEDLRELLLTASEELGFPIVDGGVYGVTQGPRLETAAEIDRMANDGVHYVGMTAMPEACLARELGLKYAVLCQVVNHAAGRGSSAHGIDHAKMAECVGEATEKSLDICLCAMKDWENKK